VDGALTALGLGVLARLATRRERRKERGTAARERCPT
jgi:hypothetical protein